MAHWVRISAVWTIQFCETLIKKGDINDSWKQIVYLAYVAVILKNHLMSVIFQMETICLLTDEGYFSIFAVADT